MMAKTLIILVAITWSLSGQDNPPPKETPKPSPAASSDENTLLDADAKPIASTRATLQGPDGKSIEINTDANGKFTAHLALGKYDIAFPTDGANAQTLAVEMTKQGELQLPIHKSPICCTTGSAPPGRGWLACGLLLVYWLTALFARYYNIVKVNHASLLASIDGVTQEIAAIPAAVVATDPTIKTRATELVGQAKTAVEGSDGLKTFLFGMRGQIAAAWKRLDEASRIVASSYTRDQTVSRLRLVVEELRPEYANMADKIEAVLAKVNDATTTDGFLSATLNDALRCTSEKTESATEGTLNWQNKAFTLVFVGICLLIAMAVLLDHPILLFIGFIGGFASRLMRGKTSATPTEAELDWTTLLLSPIYGAFAGWAGILLLVVLKQFNVLGSIFPPMSWNCELLPAIALGLAFLLGFSERFFSAVTDLAEKTVLKDQSTTAANTPGAPKPGAGPNVGIPQGPPPAPPAHP